MKSYVIKFLKSHPEIKESDLDWMWDYCSSFPDLGGGLIKRLRDQGLSWRDLNFTCLEDLLRIYNNIETSVLNNLINDENEND